VAGGTAPAYGRPTPGRAAGTTHLVAGALYYIGLFNNGGTAPKLSGIGSLLPEHTAGQSAGGSTPYSFATNTTFPGHGTAGGGHLGAGLRLEYDHRCDLRLLRRVAINGGTGRCSGVQVVFSCESVAIALASRTLLRSRSAVRIRPALRQTVGVRRAAAVV
jgi:hypothetical protein